MGCGSAGVRAAWRAACRPGSQPRDPRRPPPSRRPPLPLPPFPGRSRSARAGTRSMELCRGPGHSDAPSTPRPEEPGAPPAWGTRGAGDIRDSRYPDPAAHSRGAAPMSQGCRSVRVRPRHAAEAAGRSRAPHPAHRPRRPARPRTPRPRARARAGARSLRKSRTYVTSLRRAPGRGDGGSRGWGRSRGCGALVGLRAVVGLRPRAGLGGGG
jgi:hypothetical protein